LQEAGTAHPSEAFAFTPVVDWVRVACFCTYFLVFCVICCLSFVCRLFDVSGFVLCQRISPLLALQYSYFFLQQYM
jgi:hypothetical protein